MSVVDEDNQLDVDDPDLVAPPVVAVVVTHDPGRWFDDVLEGLAAQDYPALSVLVVDVGSTVDPTDRVAGVLPDAYIRRLGANPGFGAAANEVLAIVEGAAFYLLVPRRRRPRPQRRPGPGPGGLPLQRRHRRPEARPVDGTATRLLQVGVSVDKFGHEVPTVEPGELDQEQHDAVRDVFCVPGAATLVRADLFATLGGFDPEISFLGEDVDLCWRAQVAGARVSWCPPRWPATGRRMDERAEPVPGRAPAAAPAPPAAGRAHQLLARPPGPGRCPRWRSCRAAEVVYTTLAGRRRQRRWPSSTPGAGTAGTRPAIKAARARLAAIRAVPDSEVRRLQSPGSARFSQFVRGQLGGGDDRVKQLTRSAGDLAGSLRRGPLRVAVAVWAAARPGAGGRQPPPPVQLATGARRPAPAARPAVDAARRVAVGLAAGRARQRRTATHRLRPAGRGRHRPARRHEPAAPRPRLPAARASDRWARSPPALDRFPPGPVGRRRHLRRHPAALRRPRRGPVGRARGVVGHAVVPRRPGPGQRRRPLRAACSSTGPTSQVPQPRWRSVLALGLGTALVAAVVPIAVALPAGLAVVLAVGGAIGGRTTGAGGMLATGLGRVGRRRPPPPAVDARVRPARRVRGPPSAASPRHGRPRPGPPAPVRDRSDRRRADRLGLPRGRRPAAHRRRGLAVPLGGAGLGAGRRRVGRSVAVGIDGFPVALGPPERCWPRRRAASPSPPPWAWSPSRSTCPASASAGARSPRRSPPSPSSPAPSRCWARRSTATGARPGPASGRCSASSTPSRTPRARSARCGSATRRCSRWAATSSTRAWRWGLSDDGLPNVVERWTGSPDGTTGLVADALDLAVDRETARLGRLLGPMGVRYIVVVEADRPVVGPVAPAPPRIIGALGEQLDLAEVAVDEGLRLPQHRLVPEPGRAHRRRRGGRRACGALAAAGRADVEGHAGAARRRRRRPLRRAARGRRRGVAVGGGVVGLVAVGRRRVGSGRGLRLRQPVHRRRRRGRRCDARVLDADLPAAAERPPGGGVGAGRVGAVQGPAARPGQPGAQRDDRAPAPDPRRARPGAGRRRRRRAQRRPAGRHRRHPRGRGARRRPTCCRSPRRPTRSARRGTAPAAPGPRTARPTTG